MVARVLERGRVSLTKISRWPRLSPPLLSPLEAEERKTGEVEVGYVMKTTGNVALIYIWRARAEGEGRMILFMTR